MYPVPTLQTQNSIMTLAQAPTPQVDLDRKQQQREAWKAYRGDFQNPLKVDKDQPDDNVIENRCETIVNKGASFLFGQPLKIEATDEQTEATTPDDLTKEKPSSPIQDFLDGLWGDDDDKMTTLSKAAINGGVTGQLFAKLIPAQGTMRFPRIVIMDSQLIRIVTDPEDCELHLAYIIEYPGVNDWQKRQIIARVDPDNSAVLAGEYDLDDTWTIQNYTRKGQQGNWQPSGPAEMWPYPFAPIFTCQNLPNPNEAWGAPDLTPDLIKQNKVLNFIESNTARIIKYHGHPVTYAVDMRADQISVALDGVLCLPSPTAKLDKLAAMDNFDGLLKVASTLRDNMDEQSRIPGVALGRLESLPKGNISGVALQLLFQPIIEKTLTKRRLVGRWIRDISRAALIVTGLLSVERYEDYKIELRFENLLPIDDLAAAQTAVLLKQLSVSTSTLLQELGYNPEDEAKKNDEEDAKAMEKASRGQGLPSTQPPMQQQNLPGQQPNDGEQQNNV